MKHWENGNKNIAKQKGQQKCQIGFKKIAINHNFHLRHILNLHPSILILSKLRENSTLNLQPFNQIQHFVLEHPFFSISLPKIISPLDPHLPLLTLKKLIPVTMVVPRHQQYPLTPPPVHVFSPFPVSLVWVLCLNLHNEDEVMAVIFSSQCLPTCNPPQSPRLSPSSQIGTQCFYARPLR